MAEMSKAEIARFLKQGTFTGKLATVKKDRSSHVVPIWFVLDNGKGGSKVGDIIFTTGEASVKANNIQRDKRVSICIDDQKTPILLCNNIWYRKNIPLQTKRGIKMGY